MYLPYYFLNIYTIFVNIIDISIMHNKYSTGNKKPCVRHIKKTI